jgi:hypothetical protein
MESGVYPMKEFNSFDDVKATLPLLMQEAINYGCPDIHHAVYNQLGTFCCPSLFIEQKYQNDIKEYLFCKDFNIPPKSGSYSEQPHKTVQKFNIIKVAISKLEEMQYKKLEQKRVNNG